MTDLIDAARPMSPIGSEPSGSRRAARWPWVRIAFTSAIAAAAAFFSAISLLE